MSSLESKSISPEILFLFTLHTNKHSLYCYYRRGTNVLKTLERAITYGETLDMMYLSKDSSITKRRINVLQVGESSFRAYCHLRKSRRTFAIDNVLALIPVIEREKAVM